MYEKFKAAKVVKPLKTFQLGVQTGPQKTIDDRKTNLAYFFAAQSVLADE